MDSIDQSAEQQEETPVKEQSARQTSPQTSTLARIACRNSCDASGYSVSLAGEAAAKACVDVCLSEAGDVSLPSVSPEQASASSGDSGSTTEAQRLLAGIGSGATVAAAPKLAGKLSGSLRTLVAKEGVDEDKLPEVSRNLRSRWKLGSGDECPQSANRKSTG